MTPIPQLKTRSIGSRLFALLPEGAVAAGFYRIECRAPRPHFKSWRAGGEIVRNDSGEVVERVFIRKASSPQEAERLLREALEDKLRGLPAPADWGRDATVPALIEGFLAFNDEAYGYHLRWEEASGDEATARREEGLAFESAYKQFFCKALKTLTEEQRIALATPTAQELARPWADDYAADAFLTRVRLLELMPQRTPAVEAGYCALRRWLDQGPIPSK